jgi:thiamine biosynthesis lipoprotein
VLAACAAPTSTEGALARHEYRQVRMGVQARIVLWTDSPERAERAAEAAFERLARVEQALSDWLVDGELARLEARAGGEPVEASADLAACLEGALGLARATDGAFDPTLGPITRLWREARRTGHAPSDAAIEAARARTGWQHVELDPAARTVRLALPGMQLDFGGIGKGFGADRALETLREHGIERALVGLAGDHALGAAPPDARGWRIQAGSERRMLDLAYCGVSTSGDSEQHFDGDGVRTSHILDPRTGRGVAGRPQFTVVAGDAATADALATALCVVGLDGANAILGLFPGARAYLDTP